MEGDKRHGQNVRDAFPLADLFVEAPDKRSCRTTIVRFIHALFGDNETSPTHDEYGIYLAKSASLRSSALTRQVSEELRGRASFRFDCDWWGREGDASKFSKVYRDIPLSLSRPLRKRKTQIFNRYSAAVESRRPKADDRGNLSVVFQSRNSRGRTYQRAPWRN